MGGRVAEEIEFNEMTSGAAGDIKAATKRAKSMVCDLGMSDLGTVFLNEDKYYSEQTEQRIDEEIARIIKEQYDRAQKILHENYHLVQKLAEALLKYETIEGKHVYELVKSGDFVTKQMLELYGKTYVTFRKYENGIYLLDF
jgi:cell division protease FtsH